MPPQSGTTQLPARSFAFGGTIPEPTKFSVVAYSCQKTRRQLSRGNRIRHRLHPQEVPKTLAKYESWLRATLARLQEVLDFGLRSCLVQALFIRNLLRSSEASLFLRVRLCDRHFKRGRHYVAFLPIGE